MLGLYYHYGSARCRRQKAFVLIFKQVLTQNHGHIFYRLVLSKGGGPSLCFDDGDAFLFGVTHAILK